ICQQIENLRCSGPVFAEFNRITSRNFEADFFEALDQQTPRFIQLFESKKGSVGQKLMQSINWV
ncbi:Deleted in malignant brain tumors 1 protein, partial [Dissostichus eleginoides]